MQMYHGHYLIREWDDSVDIVWVNRRPNSRFYHITYSDLETHVVSEEYLNGLVVRRAFNSEVNVH